MSNEDAPLDLLFKKPRCETHTIFVICSAISSGVDDPTYSAFV